MNIIPTDPGDMNIIDRPLGCEHYVQASGIRTLYTDPFTDTGDRI
jgi:hypothetical protein